MPTDRITIVNEADSVIGSEDRSIARAQGLRHRIVRVFLVNSEGKVLLHRRSEKLKDNPGKWDQSVGGHVDEGEDYITAARRETQEELGIAVEKFEEIGKFYIEREAPGGFVRRFQAVFIARGDGPVKLDESEIAEIRWFDIAEAAEFYSQKPDAFTKNFARAFELLQKALAT
ncbi:MAG TPA: NUDIX domain-containing protein [Candidatus Saccharimonadia bacterium]|nr:NUDIX domain-containing protein [Candidatus Saccharimonadia bacterium]